MSDLETLGEGSFEETTPEQTTPEATPAPESTPAPEVTPADPASAAPVTPEFTANYKFKVMDKEHEIPEAFRGIIKDAESEKLAREIFEKAYGLDYVKPKYESTKTELETLRKEYEPIKKDLNVLQQLLENQDLGGFFGAFGLTDEQIIKHAMERIEYHQLPPEKQQAMDKQRQQSYQYYKTSQELNELKAQQAQTELQNTVGELKAQVSSPHISPIVESFNARAGQPDAFEKAVIAHAQNHFALYKQDLTVPQAIESFIRTFGLTASQPSSPAAAPASVPAAQRKDTLPKSGSSSAAPVKSKIKSIDDIRKVHQQFMEN